MSMNKMAGLLLLVGGALGLLYGTFSYTKETHRAKVGPLELAVKERESVNVPVWLGVGAVVAGGLMLALPRRRT